MATPPDGANRGPSQEALLLDYVQRLEKRAEGRKVVHLRLSGLQPINRRDQHIRAAADCFESLIGAMAGQLFKLKNNDFFFIYKAEAHAQTETAVRKARFLFGDDPLIAEESKAPVPFAKFYNAASDFPEIHRVVRELADAERKRDEEVQARPDARAGLKAKQQKGEALTPETLDRVEQALQRADLSNLMRRQFVCTVTSKNVPEPFFSELFISINDLRETVLPDVNLMSNRWLFQHLTMTLDRRMLSLLSKSDRETISGNISFNVNVATVLSPDFLAFDDNISANRRGAMIVELQKEDILADVASYLFAREFAQSRGYRVCLDGMNYRAMLMLNRERVGADLMKLVWNSELVDGGEEVQKKLQGMVTQAGEGKIVLCRCDNREAVDFGRTVGITLFQGRYIEQLIAEDTRRRELLKIKRRIEASR